MNSLKLQIARMRKGKTSQDMGEVIGKSRESYSKKETGEIRFSYEEVIAVADALDLSLQQVNTIIFDGKLKDENNSSP